MNASLQKNLFKLCRFSDDQEWKLLYRGSRDGFDPRFFHSKCDKMKNNLTVIKSESSNVFGGYLEYIAGNSNSNKTSLFNFGNTFKNPGLSCWN